MDIGFGRNDWKRDSLRCLVDPQLTNGHKTVCRLRGEPLLGYAKRHGLLHAQCWSHCRRNFERSQGIEPEVVAAVLALIGSLYGHEKIIRKEHHEGAAKRTYRLQHSALIVEAFFTGAGRKTF